jgi:hypothetical protein
MTEANRNLNFDKGYSFSDLSGRTYVELGTGIDNIMRFFRLDLVWRVTPSPLPKEGYKRFGVFGSFRVGF